MKRRSPQPPGASLTPDAEQTHDPRLLAFVDALAALAAEEDHYAELEQRRKAAHERAKSRGAA